MQQPQPIKNYQQRRSHVGGDGAPQGGDAGEGQRDKRGFKRQGKEDVLFDHVQGPAGMADQPGQLREIVRHERDVGGFDGRIGPHCSHGDAHAGEAIAGASFTPLPTIAMRPGFPAFPSPLSPCLRGAGRHNIRQFRPRRDCSRGAPVVTGQHHDPADPETLEGLDGGLVLPDARCRRRWIRPHT